MTLDTLTIGKSAPIQQIGGAGALRRHLLDMGVTPGTEVTLRKTAPMGDPIELEIRGYALALRLDEAKKIRVVPLPQQHQRKTAVNCPPSAIWPEVGNVRPCRPKKPGTALPQGAPLTFALAGNQNCGKTTLFNQLTGANQHVGNFPGVTVDKKEGVIGSYFQATVTDLPGIYSLSPYSQEEIVTRDFLLQPGLSGIINIVDATNIQRNLYLTLQLLELEIPMVLALNMMDEVRENGGAVCTQGLEALLGIPVVAISAAKNEGIDALIAQAIHVARYRQGHGSVDMAAGGDPAADAAYRCIRDAALLLTPYAHQAGLPLPFAAAKMVEGDPLIAQKLRLPPDEQATLARRIAAMESETNSDRETALANMRFAFIAEVCRQTVIQPGKSKERRRSEAIDRVLTGKYTAVFCFLLIMALVFAMTFSLVGAVLSDWLSAGIDGLIGLIDRGMLALEVHPVARSLVVDGLCQGIGSVLRFLPTIVILFFFLSLLEDSGYMARVAFVMDKPMRHIGLSGRSFVPLLTGFGCSVPAIMATRTLPRDRDRQMTILLTPFMSCSAKLPIYALFVNAFFSRQFRPLVMVGLYALGIVCGVGYAWVLEKTKFRGEPAPFVLELPNYRLPSAKNVGRLIWDKAKGFMRKAFTIILVSAVIIWFLRTFDPCLRVASRPESSLLARIGSLAAPVLRPLGFADWRVSTALITGFTAKESVVSTLTVLLGDAAGLTTLFTPLTALTFLTFTLLYTPCVAAIAAVRKETGRTGFAMLTVLAQCVIAWLVAFVLHTLGLVLGLS